MTRVATPVSRSFFARDTTIVARSLLGCFLTCEIGGEESGGRIVEVEAYVGPHDPAAHGFGNRMTPRNRDLFGPPGTAYVYFIYGMHWCFNAVTERDGYPAAVLIRALEPLQGLDVMCRRRGTDDRRVLCSGPARLCEALGITGEVSGTSLSSGPVRVLGRGRSGRCVIARSARIGVSRAADWPLRYYFAGSPWLSRRY